MPDITKLENVDRWETVTNAGTNIVRKIYVEPYDAHIEVITKLIGGVSGNDVIDPSTDSYYPFLFCCDARLESFAAEGMLSSPSTGFGGDVKLALRTKENPKGRDGKCGAYIMAVYKPLIFGPVTSEWNKWDFVNPLLTPVTFQTSCGRNTKYLIPSAAREGAGTLTPFPTMDKEGFLTQPMFEFTVERRMVSAADVFKLFAIINTLKGKVNAMTYTFAGYEFPKECLRFDDCRIEKRVVPDSTGAFQTWYDILYKFTYNSVWDEYFDIGDYKYKSGFVTWNRSFGTPMDVTGLLPIKMKPAGSTEWEFARSCYYDVGWKSDVFGAGYRRIYIPDVNSYGGKTFADLFKRGL